MGRSREKLCLQQFGGACRPLKPVVLIVLSGECEGAGAIDYSESGSCVHGVEKSPYQEWAL